MDIGHRGSTAAWAKVSGVLSFKGISRHFVSEKVESKKIKKSPLLRKRLRDVCRERITYTAQHPDLLNDSNKLNVFVAKLETERQRLCKVE